MRRLFKVFVPQHMTLFSCSSFVAKCKQCFSETVLKKKNVVSNKKKIKYCHQNTFLISKSK